MVKKTFWISVIGGLFVLLLLVLASSVLRVGSELESVHRLLAWAFYALALVLAYVLVINPLRVIIIAPTFSIDALEDGNHARTYKRAARTIRRLPIITKEEADAIDAAKGDTDATKQAIRTTFNGSIKEEIDQTIIKHSQTVLLTTAISQNGNLDMFAVIINNIRMIRAITKACGFRPSFTHLGKLSVNVAITAMIAENLEGVDISEAMPSRFSETIRDIPVVRGMTNSVFQGISNGMLTCRIGIVTRKYLFKENKLNSTHKIRLDAYRESFKLMPKIVTGGLSGFPKGFMNFMVKPFFKNPLNKKGQTNE